MNRLQQAEYNILKFFDKFTKENNLKYFLYAGTLLGAIRHKGFIPWDDDIDVGMLREEFDRFEMLFLESNYKEKGFIYQSRKNYPYQALPLSKIRSNELKMAERMPTTQKGNYGPWIDIFPFDNIPDNLEERRKQYKKVNFYNNIIKKTLLIQVEPEDHGIKKNIKKIIQWSNERFHEYYFFLPYVFKKRHYYMTKYNNIETTHVADISYMHYKSFEDYSKRFFRKKDLENLTVGHFEEDTFNIPANYDEILKTHYGEYMKLPPENERKIHKIEYEIEN